MTKHPPEPYMSGPFFSCPTVVQIQGPVMGSTKTADVTKHVVWGAISIRAIKYLEENK